MPARVRLGVVGLGNIGQTHIRLIQDQQVERVDLTAISSRTPPGPEITGYGIPHFTSYDDMLRADVVDAVLIATPTMLHPVMGEQALAQGLHVLMEKPLAMSVGQAQAMLDRAGPAQKFAVMLNQRFHPHYSKMKTLIDSGAIGQITRVAWMMTAWYRPDIYYQVSAWRGTWQGEGGGLVINQCIHNLDILQWLTGLPTRVSAIAGFGKYHNIDVEDEFTATLSYADGATGVVVASSGEAPGINQLDIVGDTGMLRFNGDTIELSRSKQSIREHCFTTDEMFGMPQFDVQTVPVEDSAAAVNQHAQVLQNFVTSILDDTPLQTPAEEGLASLHLANGILLAAWTDQPQHLPLDADQFESELQKRIATTSLRTPVTKDVEINMDKSFR